MRTAVLKVVFQLLLLLLLVLMLVLLLLLYMLPEGDRLTSLCRMQFQA